MGAILETAGEKICYQKFVTSIFYAASMSGSCGYVDSLPRLKMLDISMTDVYENINKLIQVRRISILFYDV